MIPPVPLGELQSRMARFRAAMDAARPEWAAAALFTRVNLYYFAGTMQEGLLLVPRGGEAVLWVRRSHERARAESLFPDIRPMGSFRDAAAGGMPGGPPGAVFIEAEAVPVAFLNRFLKYFPFAGVEPADPQIAAVRAVKSAWELAVMEEAGRRHARVLEERVPGLLREGMSETEFAAALYAELVAAGHQGTVRFSSFGTEMAVGQLGFGESSLMPTPFNGPGGNAGSGPGAPVLGDPSRRLRPGDFVFVDIGFAMQGYHTDKTQSYIFKGALPPAALAEHRRCVELQRRIAAMLRPGAVPSRIYEEVMGGLEPPFLANFMGFGARRVKFLGHGIGLHIDEPPVIARGFDEPLEQGMVFAVEPKKGVAGVGMVGNENTYVVTPGGGRSITGSCPDVIPAG